MGERGRERGTSARASEQLRVLVWRQNDERWEHESPMKHEINGCGLDVASILGCLLTYPRIRQSQIRADSRFGPSLRSPPRPPASYPQHPVRL